MMKQRRIISGFTLIEMMTAVGLIVIIIIGVAIVFQSVGKVVGLSQVTLRLMSDVRAVQQQMASDVAGLDRGGFLVIRSRVDPNDNNPNADLKRRFDQVCFLANGSFRNRTGTKSTSPFTDQTTANAAIVWWGQLVLEGVPGMLNAKPTADQTAELGISDLPSGGTDKDFILGRHCFLLYGMSAPLAGGTGTISGTNGDPSTNVPINTYPDVILGTTLDPAVMMGTGENNALPRITSSRLSGCSLTSAQVMQAIMTGAGSPRSNARYEAHNYCYRYKTLPNIWATEQQKSGAPYLPNGYFRMHPIVLQGVGSFAIEWTDGTSGAGGTNWYGLANTTMGVTTAKYDVGSSDGDSYTAIFSFDNRINWPKALRVRFRVTDQNDRMQGGREFVEVLKLPD